VTRAFANVRVSGLAILIASLALGFAMPGLPGGAALAEEDGAATLLREAVDSPARSEEERARDPHRHPYETLRFFGIEPDMHVLELWPGHGWYTEILAPYLRERGRLPVANAYPSGPEDQYVHRMARTYMDRLQAGRERLGTVEVIVVAPPDLLDLGDDASYDAVVTFRNNHSWIRGGIHDEVYREIARVLKPGGILGVVQHRADEGTDPARAAETGYVPESFVIEAAQRAGLELEERSEINANPRDTKDHPHGVWTLPPSLRLGDEDREAYEAIGESDRMTLRFRKPAAHAGSESATDSD
jgi:predicted methyltransferase